MTKKIALLISILCTYFSVQAQEKVLELPDSFSSTPSLSKESYALPNQLLDGLMLLLEERKKFKSYLFDANYALKAKITTEVLPHKYKNLLGYNIHENNYSLFFTNNRNTKFGVQIFDFKNEVSSIKLLDFKLKKEMFIDAVNYKNKIHILTVSKGTSDLNIYTFDKNLTAHKNVVSLKHLEYKNPINGFTFFAHNIFSHNDIAKIESNSPNVIETTSKEIKIYQQNQQLILSFDHRIKNTHLYYIDLNTYQTTHKTIEKPSYKEEGFVKSNSYIFDNKIFQIASSNKKMKFTIKDLSTKEKIREYAIHKKDTITFKNSPIIQEGGGAFPGISENQVREMEKTAKYLRKISSANLGISVYKVDGKYNIILGGTKKINSGGTFASGFGTVGTIGSTGAFSVGFNPTFYGYGGYSSTKSTYINCLFDVNFNHVKGDIPLNSFDRINDFEDTLDDPFAVNLFRHHQQLHFGYFDRKDKTYKLYKFEK
ncbi:hypothetical protein [Aquimarina sp. RZ0]|uniref:hypothetical protein n=1 Tax=Aquimarina sp. RZ0 TaxID=2607730 RepID=UPI0011F3101C|nr:hypothetical protein [Aquimarina sp. RZ0]KAA1246199.1 hypothetical protein F0000_08665 [Aquimarina sp. RZ0]